MLRANFCSRTPSSLKLWGLNNFDNKNFFVLYEKDKLFYDLDYALVWRASQVNSLFNLATTITKKKKNIHLNHEPFTSHLVNGCCLFDDDYLFLCVLYMLKAHQDVFH